MKTGLDAILRPALFVLPFAPRALYLNGVMTIPASVERMMRKMLVVLTAILMLCLAAGCGSDKEKGQNRDKDKPRAGETAN
jgi:hypothetical protein